MSIFYDIRKLPIDKKIELLYDAKKLSCIWWADYLDCSESFRRQTINMTFDEIIAKAKKDCHYVFVYRNEFNKEYYEIGFSTLNTSINYFLWIHVDIKKANSLIKKYDLLPM